MEELKYVIIDTTSVPRNTTNLNASFNRLYDNMKSRGIDITATGLVQCIDVYLRVLCFCKNIRFATDLYAPARARLDCVRLNTEMTKEHLMVLVLFYLSVKIVCQTTDRLDIIVMNLYPESPIVALWVF